MILRAPLFLGLAGLAPFLWMLLRVLQTVVVVATFGLLVI